MEISILGDGGWGTTLGILLHKKGYKVTLWSAFPKYASLLDVKRHNIKFLPGIKIPRGIKIVSDLNQALDSKEVIVLAIPSQYLRAVLKRIKASRFIREAALVSAVKGIELNSLKRMSEVIMEELGKVKLAVLSGPTIAHEVVRGIPTTAVIASNNRKLNNYLQNLFFTDRFRVYTNCDLIGTELGGSLKNIIAIACGISDGLGFGTNTKAAILSRGLAEISRLGLSLGADKKTFSGISGLGDLVTTCISRYSRNRFVGEQIAKGKSLKFIISGMQMIAEGVSTSKSAYQLSLRQKVDMPITKQVYLVLYKDKSPLKAVKDLMTREKKGE